MDIKPTNDFWYRLKNNTEQEVKQRFNVEILRNNKDLTIYDGEWVKLIKSDHITHIVKPTETLEAIAQSYKITKQQIMLDNVLKDEKLFIGQSLKIKTKQ